MLFCLQHPSFAVDTHVWRLCSWLGWVPKNATRDESFSHCEVRIPDDLKYTLHQLLIKHGKSCPKCQMKANKGTQDPSFGSSCPLEHLVSRFNHKASPGKGRKRVKKASKHDEDEADEVSSDLSELEDQDDLDE